jgi:hypothetical protein
MENQISIFNIGEHSAALNEQMYRDRGESPLFDIRVKNVGDTTSFIVRPVPYILDVLGKSKVEKFYYVFEVGGQMFVYDSMTTFNRPDQNHWEFCAISDIWGKLKNSKDPNVQNMAMQLRRQVAIYIYVMVVNCPAEPKFNGRIMPMKIPIEIDKAMKMMAKPTEAQLALGQVPVQPFDIYNGCNLVCTITGHKPHPNDPLMRDWKVVIAPPSELALPLGPGNSMVNISKLQREQVEAFFVSQQTIDLQETYGYKAPNADTNIKAYQWLSSLNIVHVPGIREAIQKNFQLVVDNAIGNPAVVNAPPVQVHIPDPIVNQYQVSDPMAAMHQNKDLAQGSQAQQDIPMDKIAEMQKQLQALMDAKANQNPVQTQQTVQVDPMVEMQKQLQALIDAKANQNPEQPVQNAVAEQPVQNAVAEQPVQNAVAEQPVQNAVAEQPVQNVVDNSAFGFGIVIPE